MSGIIIQDVSPRVQYTATGGQTVFTIPFQFFATSDITAYYTPTATLPNDQTQILVNGVDYTVTITSPSTLPSVGTLTLTNPATAGYIVTIVRAQPDARLNWYIDGGLFSAYMFNSDFDMDVLMIQQNNMYNTVITPHYNLSDSPVNFIDNYLPKLAANQFWVMNSTRTQIIAATIGNVPVPPAQSSVVILTVNQIGHGLTFGQIVKCTGANTFAVAQADSSADAEVAGIVYSVIDANNFVLLVGGIMTGLTGLTAGAMYYLDPAVAGGVTLTKSVTAGQIVKPVYIAVSSSSAVWVNMLGVKN